MQLKRTITSLLIGAFVSLGAMATTEWRAPMSTPEASEGDVTAMSPWELLGETDGLGDASDEAVGGNFADLRGQLASYASKYLGCKYVWGGKGPVVFDCSGFTSFVFRNFGYNISPSSRVQGAQGKLVAVNQVQTGDLLFFSGRAGGPNVGHVGMVVDRDPATGSVKFIHASSGRGHVTYSRYPDDAYYKKHFLHARSVL